MTAIRESICPKLVNIKSVIDITPPEPEEMTQRAEHSDAKVASTTTAREGADREVFHRCSHGGQSRPPWRPRNGPISKQRAFIGTFPCPFGTERSTRVAPSLRKFLSLQQLLVTIADCGLAQCFCGDYMARHRVSAERLGLAAIDAPD